MVTTKNRKLSGLTGLALRIWGFVFVMFGIAGRGILQNNLLNLGNVTMQQLLDAMEESETVMLYATVSLGLQALETCAIPIFAFLLVEGARHTSNFEKYALRIAGTALLSEIPFNMAMSGKWLDMSSRNPMFGLVFAMIALYFFQKFSEKKASHIFVKVITTVAAMLWCIMLNVEFGAGMVFIVVILWIWRENYIVQHLAGALASLICSMFSMFFITAPMSFLAIHFYNGEKGQDSKLTNYLAYPVILLVLGVANMLFL